MNLYEITREAQELAFLLESEEYTPELAEALSISRDQVQDKGISYVRVIVNEEADIDAIDNQMQRLKEMKERKQRVITRLKETLKNAMLVCQIDKIESPLFKISLRRSEAVEVDLVEALPADFVFKKVTLSGNKVAIKEAIKRGESITGARIVENFSLQIK